jgi:antitoxin component YwqK of YwqJK toxin-antitoxin module
MKIFLTLSISLSFALSAFGQNPDYPDSGFANKAEAKNKKVLGLKEGKWYERVKWYDEPFSSSVPAEATDANINDWYTLTVYKKGKPYGIARRYDLKGILERESPYVNGKRNGTEKQFYTSGKLFWLTKYRNDTLMDTANGYFESGKLLDRVIYKNGEKNGVEKLYYESGTLNDEYPWVNDTLNGIAKEYYEDGKLERIFSYANGKSDSVEIHYYDNGAISYEGFYIKGQPTGNWKEYYKNGKLKSLRIYNNGAFLGGTDYDENGKEIK